MSSAPIKVTILGSGTSMGVPSLGCHCRVCTSSDPHDNRLRPSLLLSRNGQNVVIDTTPDFRQQALRVGLERLDAILLTHGHADHILGFDDIRPFNIRQNTPMPVYGSEETFEVIRRAFAYVFDGRPTYSTIPSVTLHEIHGPFELMGVQFVPVPLLHGDLEVLGFRFGRAAYLTDFGAMPDSSFALLEDLDVLILDALRDQPHPMHQTVEQALALIERVKPRQAWFTHIAHDLSHAETNERLAKLGLQHVALAYDGLQFDVRVDEPGKDSHSRAPYLVGSAAAGRVTPFASPAEWSAHYGADSARQRAGHRQFRRHTPRPSGNFAHGERASGGERLRRHRAHVRSVASESAAGPESAPQRLSTNAQRMEWFGVEGLEAAVVMPFTMELARLSPEDFVVGNPRARPSHVRGRCWSVRISALDTGKQATSSFCENSA